MNADVKMTKEEWLNFCIEESKLFDIAFSRWKEIYDLFLEKGYHIKDDEHFELMKKNIFNKSS